MTRPTSPLIFVVLVILTSCLFVVLVAEEVCCCPDLNLKLTATESDAVKSVENGYMFVAKEGTDVVFNCELADKDHPAIKSVNYEIDKTWSLDDKLPIKFTSKTKNVCPSSTSPSCTVTSVTYSADPVTDSDTAANHYYQCYAQVVLIDDSVVSIFSSSVRLDVYKAPAYVAATALTKSDIAAGKAWEMFDCTLPDANPPVKAKWSYKATGGSYVDIDYTSGRGDRLAVMEDTLTSHATSTLSINRGSLILMVFVVSDAGNYKCHGEWDPSPLSLSTFGGVQGSTEITDYSLGATGSTDSGALSLDILSETPSKVTLTQESEVSFTVYPKDTPGRGSSSKYKDVVYTWTLGDGPLPNDPDNLVLSNFDRTLTVKDMLTYADDDKYFKLEVKRNVVNSGNEEEIKIVSNKLSITKMCDLVPKYLYVPLTYKKCLAMDAPIVVKTSREYMMDNEAVASTNYKQILFAVGQTRYFVHDYENHINYIISSTTAYNNDTDLAIDAKKIQTMSDAGTTLGTCVYVRNTRLSSTVYSIIEPAKIQRVTGGCGALPADFCTNPANFDLSEAKEGDNTKFTLQFTSPVPQCILADLKKKEEVLESVAGGKTAATCKDRAITMDFSIDTAALSGSTDYKITVHTEGEAGCDISLVSCSKPPDLDPSTTLTPASARIPVGGEYTVTCPEGHTPVSQELVCGGDGSLTPAAPEPCVMKQPVEKDEDSDDTVYIIIAVVAVVVVVAVIGAAVVFKFKASICPSRHSPSKEPLSTNPDKNEIKVNPDTENGLEMTGNK